MRGTERGTDCHMDSYFKPVTEWSLRKRLFVLFIKKCLGIKSPSIMAVYNYEYEYDYFKEKYKNIIVGGNIE